jgi:hypothetical protein
MFLFDFIVWVGDFADVGDGVGGGFVFVLGSFYGFCVGYFCFVWLLVSLWLGA